MGELQVARRVFTWAATTGRMRWQEYNFLMRVVVRKFRFAEGCHKQTFLNFERAKSIAARPHREGPRRAYHCDICGMVHITRIEPEIRRARVLIKAKRAEIERA